MDGMLDARNISRLLEQSDDLDIAWKDLAMDLLGEMQEHIYNYAQIFSSIPSSALLISSSGKVKAASQQMINRYLQKPQEEITGQSIFDLDFPIFADSKQSAFIKSIVREGLAVERGHTGIMLEGKDNENNLIYIELSMSTLKSSNDGFMGIILYLSEQKIDWASVRAEHEKELVLNKMGKISAGVLHEIKNPIQSITGIIQLAQLKYKEDQDLQNMFAIMEKEMSHINYLVTEFLSNRNKDKTKMTYCSINYICKEIVDLVHSSCYLDNIEINYDLGENIPDMVMDHSKIKRVLMNFVLNSIEAIKAVRGSDLVEQDKAYPGKIKVKTYYDFGLNECHISIEDNGIGMTEEVLKNLTKPFFTTKDYGTGMGMSISHGIILEHDGILKVHNVEGLGAKFEIILPELAGLAAADKDLVAPQHSTSHEDDNILNNQDIIKDGISNLLE